VNISEQKPLKLAYSDYDIITQRTALHSCTAVESIILRLPLQIGNTIM